MAETKPFKKLTRRLAIIAKCRQCSVTSKLVKECTCTECALYPFRLGKSPKPDVNALDLTVFIDDPSSVIFRVRQKDDGTEETFSTEEEYSAFMDDDDEDE